VPDQPKLPLSGASTRTVVTSALILPEEPMRLALHRARRGGIALGVVGLLAPVAVAVAPPASAACASRTTKSISGTVYGVDNRDVNVSIGFDVQDANGRLINVSDGCAKSAGYSAPVKEYNHYVGYTGATKGSMQHDYKGVEKGSTIRNWSLTNLPSNAKSVFVEVYARDYKNYNNPSAMGPVNTAKYGFARRVQLPVGTANAMIRLPINCNFAAGSNGAIAGAVSKGGVRVTPDHVWAFSDLKDTNYTPMGWGMAVVSGSSYKVNALASGEVYHLQLVYQGRTYVKRDIRVSRCATTGINWAL
jgi:hypothetical protein